MIEGGSWFADPQVGLKLPDEHKAALISAIEEVVQPADDPKPGTNTTFGNAIQPWPLNRGSDLASEPL